MNHPYRQQTPKVNQPVRKFSCKKKLWHENFYFKFDFMHDNDISMHDNYTSINENAISMHKNVNLAPNVFMNENAMHEIVHSPISHENC